jgi:hypothetical protein
MSDVRTEGEVDERLMLRMSAMLADQLRTNIVCECRIRPMSPRSFRQEFGGPSLAKVQEAFAALERAGWLELAADYGGRQVDELDRLYRTAAETIVNDEAYATLPDSVRSLLAMRMLESLSARTREAMRAGTIVARDDAHLTWTALSLDQRGWDAVTARLAELFGSLAEIQEAAGARMAGSGEEPIAMTVGLLGFESPRH